MRSLSRRRFRRRQEMKQGHVSPVIQTRTNPELRTSRCALVRER